eukprot:GILJ01047373.1.p2 GENE.GILJ01047373.1~~GILJ01047373.1.p2  ORF type:complete len:106 (+),score=10.76 GILJ01047373.1:182-499(+)
MRKVDTEAKERIEQAKQKAEEIARGLDKIKTKQPKVPAADTSRRTCAIIPHNSLETFQLTSFLHFSTLTIIFTSNCENADKSFLPWFAEAKLVVFKFVYLGRYLQ